MKNFLLRYLHRNTGNVFFPFLKKIVCFHICICDVRGYEFVPTSKSTFGWVAIEIK